MAAATQIISDYLNLHERPMEDNSIKSIEYYETKISGAGEENNPRFHIEHNDQWVLPCEAWLQIQGEIVKAADGSVYGDNDNVAFVNNGPLCLFDSAIYKINNETVETVNKPGMATFITSLVDYSHDHIMNMGEQLMIAKDIKLNNTDATNTGFTDRKQYKKFDVRIPLSHIFGFARDVKKVMYGMTHTLELARGTNDNDAIFRKGDVDAAKVKLTGLSLWMPRVIPSENSIAKLYNFISKKGVMNTPFKQIKYFENNYDNSTDFTWNITQLSKATRPRNVFVTFQLKDKENDQEKNNAIFDTCSVKNISLVVNGNTYPRFPYSINFASKIVGRPFGDLLNYRGIDQRADTGMLITKSDFLTRYPVYHFNLERLQESLNDSISSITLNAELNAGAKYKVYVVIMADKELQISGDGTRMNLKTIN